MRRLIEDLLTYSRVGRKGKPLAPVDTGRVLDHALDNLELAIEETGARVSHNGMPTVLGDEGQLVQLFQNLLSNALKFRAEDTPRVEIDAEERDDEVVFSVRDNGIGIAPDHAERIFLMFQRLHGRDEYPGTGIGLALCKRIVERHGGRMWVESDGTRGSTFRFSLPTPKGRGG